MVTFTEWRWPWPRARRACPTAPCGCAGSRSSKRRARRYQPRTPMCEHSRHRPTFLRSRTTKATGIFTSTGTIHGGQETTILTALVPLIHLGMVFVGTPYGQNPQILVADGIGGSPYGPGTLAGTDGSRQPVETELTTARNLGSRLARVAGCLRDLRAGRASTP